MRPEPGGSQTAASCQPQVRRRSQKRQLAAGRESLEDSLGASEQVVHFQVPRHETCVAKLSWISEIRPLVYAASFPQGQQFHLEYQLAQYPILLVGDMLMWIEISSVQQRAHLQIKGKLKTTPCALLSDLFWKNTNENGTGFAGTE